MATQRSIAKKQVAFQETMGERMQEIASAIQEISKRLKTLEDEVNEVKLATLRVERKVKEGEGEG